MTKVNIELDAEPHIQETSKGVSKKISTVETKIDFSLGALNDTGLLLETKRRVANERKAINAVLEVLREIDERKLYAKMGFSSLFGFAHKVLGYTEAEAGARITAARLIKQIPALSEKLEAGNLSLTQVVKASAFFNQEKKADKPLSKEEKTKVFEIIENKSIRESERMLLSLSSNPEALMERTRAISPSHSEIRFVVDQSLMNDLNRLKEIWAHTLPNANWQELIRRMAAIALEKEDPLRKAERSAAKREKARPQQSLDNAEKPLREPKLTPSERKAKDNQSRLSRQTMKLESDKQLCRTVSSASEVAKNEVRRGIEPVAPAKRSRSIPAAIKHAVWLRDGGQCTYRSLDGKRCNCRYGLEIDHIQPFGSGGDHSLGNLRLSCRAHNSWRAIQHYGHQKMSQYQRQRSRQGSGITSHKFEVG